MLTCCHNSTFHKNHLFANMREYYLDLFNFIIVANKKKLRKNLIDNLNLFLLCTNEILVFFLGFYKYLHGQILSLSSSSSFNYDILVLACLPLNQTFAARET